MPALKVWVANERLTSADLNATFASVQLPDGVVASAAANATTGAAIPLTTVVEGKASYLSGGRIVTPRAGLYLVSGLITVTNGVGALTNTHHVTIVNTPIDFDVVAEQLGFKANFALPCVLASGTQITASYTVSGGSASCTIHRLGFLFMGTGYAP